MHFSGTLCPVGSQFFFKINDHVCFLQISHIASQIIHFHYLYFTFLMYFVLQRARARAHTHTLTFPGVTNTHEINS